MHSAWVILSLLSHSRATAGSSLSQVTQQTSIIRRHAPGIEDSSGVDAAHADTRQKHAQVNSIGDITAVHGEKSNKNQTSSSHKMAFKVMKRETAGSSTSVETTRRCPHGSQLLKNQDGKVPHQNFCNVNITLGPKDSDACDYGRKVDTVELCDWAIDLMRVNGMPQTRKPANAQRDYIMNDDYLSPLPFPRECFLMEDGVTVKYNPTPTVNPPNRSNARPICYRELYPSGVLNSKNADRCEDASGDYMPIPVNEQGYLECLDAKKCLEGPNKEDGCSTPAFNSGHRHESDTEPPGCFKMTTAGYRGCWSFNWKPNPNSNEVMGEAVCRLKEPQNWVCPSG